MSELGIFAPSEQAMSELDAAIANGIGYPDGYLVKLAKTVRVVMEEAIKSPDGQIEDWVNKGLDYSFRHPGLVRIARSKAAQARWMLDYGTLVSDEAYIDANADRLTVL